jgi:preprotein translocase subunit SecA
MLNKIFAKIFGTRNDRILNKLKKTVDAINQLEERFQRYSDQKLQDNTKLFQLRLKNGEHLNDLLPEAFATVREASQRVFGMRHFDVQILGGIVLNNQCIAEMRTGEGKTLTSTLPAYLNALIGKGVHIVTMNDYLARRDAEQNTPLFEFLNLTVGLNLSEMSFMLKKQAYLCDITYGTNNEYGFDYLRDNMVSFPEERVQRGLHYALLDEVDSILIDEARTPLIISGPSEDSSDLYKKINAVVPLLVLQKQEDSDFFQGTGHFFIDEKSKQVHLTERGLIEVERILFNKNFVNKLESLYSSKNIVLMHHVLSALRAHKLFVKNVDYIVQNDSILIVDEHTGRAMPGRRWSDGLHQAIEAKENVSIKNENQTLASITFQNYFRLYEKISGMTGTASTEAFEFYSIYNLDTVTIPTNKPMVRKDMSDLVYITEKEKIRAIIKDIQECVRIKKPVLVGTVSIEKSELISKNLDKLNIIHNVLNAKFHAKEAEIIGQAGKSKSITIATNMAGRGTDIVLGGNLNVELNRHSNLNADEMKKIREQWQKEHDLVVSAGGLHIIGTERHESRRIDNQLIGRSGRQGDSGSSRFYISMEDSLMRIFASDKIISMMRKLGLSENESIEHPWINKAIENAQKKVESRNFDIRKQLLEYDDIINEQRGVIYAQRNILIDSKNIQTIIEDILKDVLISAVDLSFLHNTKKAYWDIIDLEQRLQVDFDLHISISEWLEMDSNLNKDDVTKKITDVLIMHYQKKEKVIGSNKMRLIEKHIMLQTLDSFWKDHLAAIDYLRQGIHLRGYAQKDPKQEYKRESFNMFSNMLNLLKYEVASTLCKINLSHANQCMTAYQKLMPLFSKNIKISRNALCVCGSGKKYKHCHGML